MAAVGFMFGASGELSVGTVLGGLTFLMLAGGIFVGAFNMSRDWDREPEKLPR
jgi:hypothetical protein